ncbi:MAG: hypothetical protein HY812_13670 [Planctomycetes bacterium]|nr:hypothetical protein [Planctomycetota bacterium]
MKERASASYLVPIAAAVGFVLLHVAGRKPDAPAPQNPAAATRAPRGAADAPSDDERRARWKEAHEPSVMDTESERNNKEFCKRMKALGTTPVEVVGDGADGAGGPLVGTSLGDLRRFLAEGGHYSGPLPPESAGDAPEDGR